MAGLLLRTAGVARDGNILEALQIAETMFCVQISGWSCHTGSV